MWLQKMQAHALRSFHDLEIVFEPGINVLFGDNGVGKTSILEGIDVLSRGKSFRASKISQIINYDLSEILIYGEVVSNAEEILKLGIKHQNNHAELHINQTKAKKWSELAVILPIVDIHPETYLLVMGGPSIRRKYLNWGVFHVEPSFLSIWREYTKALKQRNCSLKARKYADARNWHHVLSEKGEQISQLLVKYCTNLKPYVTALSEEFGLSNQIELSYAPGWDQNSSLFELLENELMDDYPYTTQFGPHRGDLNITWGGKKFSKTSSRGQQKILSIVLKLAQAELLKKYSAKSCVYLIDELPAELDLNKRKIALNLLNSIDSQVIISAVTKDSIDCVNLTAKWFHVERQAVSSMV